MLLKIYNVGGCLLWKKFQISDIVNQAQEAKPQDIEIAKN